MDYRNYELITSPEEVRATLRIYHDELAPAILTELLEVEPTRTQRKGETPTRGKKVATVNAWFLSSSGQVKSKKAEAHIEWILDNLAHATGSLRSLRAQGYRMDIVVYWVAKSINTCPQLSAEIMRRLGRFQIDCWFDIYIWPPDEEED